jgi:hypothetical protein
VVCLMMRGPRLNGEAEADGAESSRLDPPRLSTSSHVQSTAPLPVAISIFMHSPRYFPGAPIRTQRAPNTTSNIPARDARDAPSALSHLPVHTLLDKHPLTPCPHPSERLNPSTQIRLLQSSKRAPYAQRTRCARRRGRS